MTELNTNFLKDLTFSNHSQLKVEFKVPNLDEAYSNGLVKTVDGIRFSYPIQSNTINIHKDLHTKHFFEKLHSLV